MATTSTPGGSQTRSVDLPPGNCLFVGNIPGHFKQWMCEIVFVRPSQPTASPASQKELPMPNVVMIIRHAEKPLGVSAPHGVTVDGLPDRESLTPRGWQRAGALVPFLVGPDGGPGRSGLPVPQHLIASQVGPKSSSARPTETLQPLAARLDLAVDVRFLKEEVDALGLALAAAEGVTLVSWEHHLIPSIALALIDRTAAVPRTWPDDRFDVVWVFERAAGASSSTFRQVPQLLLAGDAAAPIVDAP